MLTPQQLRPRGRWLLPPLGAAALLLAACAGPAPSPAAPAAPSSEQAAVQPKVNRVVFGVEPPAVEGNELRNLSPADFFPLRPMYEHLIGVDPVSGKSVPYLATEWNLLSDGLSFSFKLRQGVPLHNGYGDFSAQDVVASWQEILKKDSLHGVAPYWQDALNAIDTPSPNEAVFRLKRPDGNFLITLSEMTGGIEPFSKAQLDKQGPATMQTGPIAGTGPYQFKERSQGRYVRYERTPYKHWRVTPDLPEFEFRFMKEASTRMASLLTNEIHVASLPQDLLGQAEKQGMKVVQGRVPALRTYFLPYCCAQKDPKDPSKGYLLSLIHI